MEFEEFIKLFDEQGLPNMIEDYMDVDEEDDESPSYSDYLQREELILSLVREKQKAPPKKIDKDFFSLFNGRSVERMKAGALKEVIEKVVGERMVLPLMKELAELLSTPEKRSDELIKNSLEKIIEYSSSLYPAIAYELTTYEQSLVNGITKKSGIKGVKVIDALGGETLVLLTEKLPEKKRGRSWRLKGGDKYIPIDDYRCFAEVFFAHQLHMLFLERCKEMDDEEKQRDIVYRSLWEMLCTRIKKYTFQDEIWIKEEAFSPVFEKFLNEEKLGGIHLGRKEEDEWVNAPESLETGDLLLLAPFVEDISMEAEAIFSQRIFYDLRTVRNVENMYLTMFLGMYEEHCQYKEWEKMEKEEHFSARVFMTKKNIPKKYIKVMEQSLFNNTFGYVEIDADCDLASFDEIEKDFMALRESCFGMEEYKNHSIRFRKLGRHKALGLYYPSYLCLAVDIRHPSSFGHEYLHMYDYEHGLLSGQYDFWKIRERYSMVLKEEVNKLDVNHPVKKQMLGKGNANLAYYLRPTEIYARCGEMYFTKIHNIKNSLMSPRYGVEYPIQDEILMKYIEEYFSTQFPVQVPNLELNRWKLTG